MARYLSWQMSITWGVGMKTRPPSACRASDSTRTSSSWPGSTSAMSSFSTRPASVGTKAGSSVAGTRKLRAAGDFLRTNRSQWAPATSTWPACRLRIRLLAAPLPALSTNTRVVTVTSRARCPAPRTRRGRSAHARPVSLAGHRQHGGEGFSESVVGRHPAPGVRQHRGEDVARLEQRVLEHGAARAVGQVERALDARQLPGAALERRRGQRVRDRTTPNQDALVQIHEGIIAASGERRR